MKNFSFRIVIVLLSVLFFAACTTVNEEVSQEIVEDNSDMFVDNTVVIEDGPLNINDLNSSTRTGWKTYVETVFGYEFNYPETWTLDLTQKSRFNYWNIYFYHPDQIDDSFHPASAMIHAFHAAKDNRDMEKIIRDEIEAEGLSIESQEAFVLDEKDAVKVYASNSDASFIILFVDQPPLSFMKVAAIHQGNVDRMSEIEDIFDSIKF